MRYSRSSCCSCCGRQPPRCPTRGPWPWRDSSGHVHAMTPGYGLARVKQMGESFGVETEIAAKLAARQSSRLLCDSVACAARCAAPRTWIEGGSCSESDSVDRVLQSGESFILATGHFSREAFWRSATLTSCRTAILSVSLPPTAMGLHPDMVAELPLWPDSRVLARIAAGDRIRVPGSIQRVSARRGGAARKKSRRPDSRRCARHRWRSDLFEALCRTGLATLLAGPGEAEPIHPPPDRRLPAAAKGRSDHRAGLDPGNRARQDVDDAGADQRIMDQILDDIERAVGLYPDQYLVDVLGTRRWDASAERWVM
jgi:hypothetical protein